MTNTPIRDKLSTLLKLHGYNEVFRDNELKSEKDFRFNWVSNLLYVSVSQVEFVSKIIDLHMKECHVFKVYTPISTLFSRAAIVVDGIEKRSIVSGVEKRSIYD